MLRPNDIGPLYWVTAEKDRLYLGLAQSRYYGVFPYPIETDDVVVSLSSIKLYGEATRITRRVWKLPTERHGRESNEDGRLLPSTL